MAVTPEILTQTCNKCVYKGRGVSKRGLSACLDPILTQGGWRMRLVDPNDTPLQAAIRNNDLAEFEQRKGGICFTPREVPINNPK